MLILLGLYGFVVLLLPGTKNFILPPLIGLVLLTLGLGLWFRQQWARWAGMTIMALVCLYHLRLGFVSGFTFSKALISFGAAWIGWSFYKDPLGEDDPEDEKKPMISLVLFLSQPRYLEEVVLAQSLSSAWGVRVKTKGEPDDEKNEPAATATFVVGRSPLFIASYRGAIYTINNFDRSYFEKPSEVAESCNEMRRRKVILEHQAWLSVDLMRVGESGVTEQEAYQTIGKVIAELAGPDCLGILCPQYGKFNIYDPSLEETLRGENPLDAFKQMPLLPVIHVADDDPAMQAAVAEARSRWPEFKQAFSERTEGQTFSVKAPITQGENTEFIWVKVAGLTAGAIHGYLDNDPANLGEMKIGDYVCVPESDLNDWVYLKDGRPVGMFTFRVIGEAQKRAQQNQ